MTQPRHRGPTPEPPAPPSAEDVEWAEELARSWVEVYKKSATTLALLRILRDEGPLAAAGIAPRFTATTGWMLTERGLYRTLRRLAEAGVLSTRRVDVARTGAKRQDFTLSSVGYLYLERLEDELV